MRSGSGRWRVLPLLGDGDAVGVEAEGLWEPEGEEVVLDHWLVTKVVGAVEPQVLEVGEGGEGGGDDARERVVAEKEVFEISESSNRWGYGATQLFTVEL